MLKRKKLLIVIILAAGLLAAGSWYMFKRSHRFDSVVTTSKSPTAQAGYTGGENRKSNTGGNTSQGGVVDTGGTNVPADTPGVTSKSGAVTVKQPATNQTLQNGDAISGTTNGISQIQYRLIDDRVGVVGQGSLNVVNGQFSGTLQFDTDADSGRLDIFSYGAAGEELNTVEIPVKFAN